MKIFLVLSAFICLTTAAFADGTYQKTRDGKTFVWNNDPQPGDQASWTGKRDDDGYADGNGTLTWYRTEKKIVTGSNLGLPKYVAIASYTGEMVRGKLNGPVVAVDASGKKFHGTYADGRRKKWLAGAPKEKTQTPPNEPAERRGELVETPAEGPREPIVEAKSNRTNKPPPPEETAIDAAAVAPAADQKPANEYDDSLRSLVGPPTALRKDANEPARSTSSPATGAKKSNSPPALDITTGVKASPAPGIAPSP